MSVNGCVFILLFLIGILFTCIIIPILSDDYLRQDIAKTKFWKWLTKFYNNFWK